MLELNKIYNEDCLVGMQRIEDKCVDLIICDLPYSITDCNWDKVIPFNELWNNYNRILKSNGVVLLFGIGKFFADIINSNRENYRYDIVWKKTSAAGFLNAKKCPLRAHENIAVFYKEFPTYNPQMTISNVPKRCVTAGYKEINGVYGKKDAVKKVWCDNGVRYPIDVIEFKKDVKG